MNVKSSIRSQFHASLDMFGQTVEVCPDDLWLAPGPITPYWQVAFHTLFYTHLYLQATESEFVAWSKHRAESQYLGSRPWPPYESPDVGKSYSVAEIMEYIAFCHMEVDIKMNSLDLAGPSGFEWLPFDKLELQFYNIRHLMHHTGELSQRLAEFGIKTDWVGCGKQMTPE